MGDTHETVMATRAPAVLKTVELFECIVLTIIHTDIPLPGNSLPSHICFKTCTKTSFPKKIF